MNETLILLNLNNALNFNSNLNSDSNVKQNAVAVMMNVLRELAIGGIDSNIQGNGGEECMNYLPGWQRFIESIIFIPLSFYAAYTTFPLDCSYNLPVRNVSRYLILTIYSLIFGAELAYKMISRTGIFLLNPCHITTIMQLSLLTMEGNSKKACFLFRVMLYFMPGAWFALAFPILNTRNLPGEVFVYYAQHIAILVVPIYLMYMQGAFEPEKSHDFGWTIFGISMFSLYHFVVLQFGAMGTRVNLNNIMCPAVSDPFQSRFYRIIAVGHQCILIPILAKSYSAMSVASVEFFRGFYESEIQPRSNVDNNNSEKVVNEDTICLESPSLKM